MLKRFFHSFWSGDIIVGGRRSFDFIEIPLLICNLYTCYESIMQSATFNFASILKKRRLEKISRSDRTKLLATIQPKCSIVANKLYLHYPQFISIHCLNSYFFCSSTVGGGARYHSMWLLQKMKDSSCWSALSQTTVTRTSKMFNNS